MKKWVCSVCGYVYEGENPPEKCPQCAGPQAGSRPAGRFAPCGDPALDANRPK